MEFSKNRCHVFVEPVFWPTEVLTLSQSTQKFHWFPLNQICLEKSGHGKKQGFFLAHNYGGLIFTLVKENSVGEILRTW